MKRLLSALCLVVATTTVLVPPMAEAKRLGGGGTSGMKRSLPAKPAPDALPAQKAATPNQATPAQAAAPTAAAAAAAPAKRSWLGPVAGIAAGLGIAALMSHLGMGEAMGNIVTMLLIAAVAFFAIRFLLRRFGPRPANAGGMQFAGAPQRMPAPQAWQPPVTPAASAAPVTPLQPVAADVAPASHAVPAGFDAAGFERAAKMIFIRLQAANDAADLNDLRAFTTPEMFAAAKLDLQDRQGAAQTTDVVQLNAQVIDVAQDAQQQIVSVRFHGLIREETAGAAQGFDEVWHLVKPLDGSREWAIAGIAQYA